MLTRFDNYVLSLFTKFSHWFQVLTGKTSFWQARMCAYGALLFKIYDVYRHLSAHKGEFAWEMITSTIGVLFIAILARDLYRVENYFLETGQLLVLYSAYQLDFILRVVRVAIIIIGTLSLALGLPVDIFSIFVNIFGGYMKIGLVSALLVLGSMMIAFALYLMCVTPLPPGKSKIQEWKESFAAGFKKLVPVASIK